MALDGTALGNAIWNALQSAGLTSTPPGDPPPDPAEAWRVVGREIVNHIKANAEVSVSVPVEASDVGLQSYTVPPAGAVATTGPIVPTSLDGTGSIT